MTKILVQIEWQKSGKIKSSGLEIVGDNFYLKLDDWQQIGFGKKAKYVQNVWLHKQVNYTLWAAIIGRHVSTLSAKMRFSCNGKPREEVLIKSLEVEKNESGAIGDFSLYIDCETESE